MIFTEISGIKADSLPVRSFANHMKLCGEEAEADAVLELYLRAAISAIEARLGTVILSREFSFTVTRWQEPNSQAIPVGQVSDIYAVVLAHADGTKELADPEAWRLLHDNGRSLLVAADDGRLPDIPRNGHADVRFVAGYGALWNDVPRDLQQAVFLLAAHYLETRNKTDLSREIMPFGVLVLIEAYRTLRMGRVA